MSYIQYILVPHNPCLYKQVHRQKSHVEIQVSRSPFLTSLTFFNGYILVLNTCYVFCLAVTTAGHKHAILAVPIIVLLITPIMSESRSAWQGAAVFIVCKRDLFPAATRC